LGEHEHCHQDSRTTTAFLAIWNRIARILPHGEWLLDLSIPLGRLIQVHFGCCRGQFSCTLGRNIAAPNEHSQATPPCIASCDKRASLKKSIAKNIHTVNRRKQTSQHSMWLSAWIHIKGIATSTRSRAWSATDLTRCHQVLYYSRISWRYINAR
jgi:hypothetical protein